MIPSGSLIDACSPIAMSRRFLTLLLILLIPPIAPCHAAPGKRPPNLILILADDLGFGDLGVYGHPAIRTPVLDRLAAGGLRLTGFHSGAPVCTPARIALLTGAYPVRSGWTQGVAGYKMGMHEGLAPDALTIAEMFQAAGYTTGIAGKWHIGDQPDTLPKAQGFASTYYLTHSNNQVRKLWRGDQIVEDPFDNRLLTQRITDEAVRFVTENRDRPFFLYLPFTAPHFPVEPHPAWKGRSDFGPYGDVVEEMDARIGDLLATLESLKLDKNTLVVFTSDNGPQQGQKASPLPFRGGKWSALEGGTRVPCILAWPGVIPANRETDQLVAAIDLLPTLARACGVDWQAQSAGKPPIDGINLWDLVLGKDGAPQRTELLHWHGMEAEPQAIRSGHWKLFFNAVNAFEGPGTGFITPEQAATLAPEIAAFAHGIGQAPFLINLRTDPGETRNLAAQNPAVVETLRARANALLTGIRSSPALPLSKPANAR